MDQAEFSEQHKIWNKVSSGWKKWDFFITEWLGNAGAQLLEMADVRDNMRVLDVAAGSGEPGLTIARKFPACKVIGTDVKTTPQLHAILPRCHFRIIILTLHFPDLA